MCSFWQCGHIQVWAWEGRVWIGRFGDGRDDLVVNFVTEGHLELMFQFEFIFSPGLDVVYFLLGQANSLVSVTLFM